MNSMDVDKRVSSARGMCLDIREWILMGNVLLWTLALMSLPTLMAGLSNRVQGEGVRYNDGTG